MTAPSTYRPGACNIGRTARRQRRRIAAVCFAGAAGYAAFVLVSDLPTVLLLALFVPLSLGTEWWLQARRSFCATLALAGRYDLRDGAGDGSAGPVDDAADRAEDRRHALRLTIAGLGAGSVLTLLVYGAAVALP